MEWAIRVIARLECWCWRRRRCGGDNDDMQNDHDDNNGWRGRVVKADAPLKFDLIFHGKYSGFRRIRRLDFTWDSELKHAWFATVTASKPHLHPLWDIGEFNNNGTGKQHGFWNVFSTSSAQRKVIDDNDFVDAVYFDFQKDLLTEYHRRLLAWMTSVGIAVAFVYAACARVGRDENGTWR